MDIDCGVEQAQWSESAVKWRILVREGRSVDEVVQRGIEARRQEK